MTSPIDKDKNKLNIELVKQNNPISTQETKNKSFELPDNLSPQEKEVMKLVLEFLRLGKEAQNLKQKIDQLDSTQQKLFYSALNKIQDANLAVPKEISILTTNLISASPTTLSTLDDDTRKQFVNSVKACIKEAIFKSDSDGLVLKLPPILKLSLSEEDKQKLKEQGLEKEPGLEEWLGLSDSVKKDLLRFSNNPGVKSRLLDKFIITSNDCTDPNNDLASIFTIETEFGNIDFSSAYLTNQNDGNGNAELSYFLLPQMDFQEQEMEGANLEGTYAPRANFSGAKLRQAKMLGADFRRANFSGKTTDLRDSDLSSAYLMKANLAKADMRGSNLTNADLSNANLKEAQLGPSKEVLYPVLETLLKGGSLYESSTLDGTKLISTDLRGADLSFANINEANFIGTNCTKTNFEGAKISNITINENTNFEEANFSFASFGDKNNLKELKASRAIFSNSSVNEKGALSLQGAQLEETNFDKAKLPKTNFRKANLQSASLTSADFTGGDFRRANLQNINAHKSNFSAAKMGAIQAAEAKLNQAILDNTNLQQANLRNSILSNAHISKANLKRANLQNANLLGSSLLSTDLTGTELTDANLINANLQGANLSATNLTGANLIAANLSEISFDDEPVLDSIRYSNSTLLPEKIRTQLIENGNKPVSLRKMFKTFDELYQECVVAGTDKSLRGKLIPKIVNSALEIYYELTNGQKHDRYDINRASFSTTMSDLKQKLNKSTHLSELKNSIEKLHNDIKFYI